jgi:LytR cell envelope-related transcriptional attenuator
LPELFSELAALPGPVKDIGAVAGLGAFLGLAILSLLYFSQARDVRRLREWAGRAPERDAEQVEETSDLAAARAEEIRQIEEERRAREEAEAAERRTAEKRDKRRERREAGLPEQTRLERIRERLGTLGRRLPEPRYLAVAVGAVVVLGVGAAVAATQLLGGGGNGTASPNAAVKRGEIEVAVLNGTNPPVNGLAGTVSDKLESEGYRSGSVGNSRSSFTQSVVMFKRGHRPEAAMVARDLRIKDVRLLSSEIRNDIAGERVAVVVGQDKANFRS